MGVKQTLVSAALVPGAVLAMGAASPAAVPGAHGVPVTSAISRVSCTSAHVYLKLTDTSAKTHCYTGYGSLKVSLQVHKLQTFGQTGGATGCITISSGGQYCQQGNATITFKQPQIVVKISIAKG